MIARLTTAATTLVFFAAATPWLCAYSPPSLAAFMPLFFSHSPPPLCRTVASLPYALTGTPLSCLPSQEPPTPALGPMASPRMQMAAEEGFFPVAPGEVDGDGGGSGGGDGGGGVDGWWG